MSSKMGEPCLSEKTTAAVPSTLAPSTSISTNKQKNNKKKGKKPLTLRQTSIYQLYQQTKETNKKRKGKKPIRQTKRKKTNNNKKTCSFNLLPSVFCIFEFSMLYF